MTKSNQPRILDVVWLPPSQTDDNALLRAAALLLSQRIPRADLSTGVDLTLSVTELSCERDEN